MQPPVIRKNNLHTTWVFCRKVDLKKKATTIPKMRGNLGTLAKNRTCNGFDAPSALGFFLLVRG